MPNLQINIRYASTEARIVNKLPDHYSGITKPITSLGGIYNAKPLINAMGITTKRFLTIISGSEPTIGEIDRYASFFKIPITDLYTSIPHKPGKKSKL